MTSHPRSFLNEDHWGQVADDYGLLSSEEFDAKYPGWANSEVFDRELRAEFRRRAVAAVTSSKNPSL